MLTSLQIKIIGIVLGVIILIGGAWAAINHFENVGYQKRVAEDAVQLNKDLIAAKAKSTELQGKLDKALYDLAQSKINLDKTTSYNRLVVSGLRDQLNAYNGSLSNNSREALQNRITTLSTVVQECTSEYATLAEHADKTELDLQTIESSWPK